MSMKRKFRVLLALISLSLALGLMSNTYSRYVADTTGDLKMLFAKWQILVNETDVTTNASSSIHLVPNMEPNENIAENKIAPSSKGYFDIDIDPSNVEVSFNYSISIELLNENMPDLMITKYAILNSTYIEGDEIETQIMTENQINGSLDITENKTLEPFTVRVYFEWYEGENEQMDDLADSDIGHIAAAEDTALDIKATIHFEQKLKNAETT